MKLSTNARRTMLATLLAGTTVLATGCSSNGFPVASLNPFSSPAMPTSPSAGEEPGVTAKLASSVSETASGARNQVSTMGSTVKSAFGKSKNALAGVFGGKPETDETKSAPDPLSLRNGPKNVGPEVLVANGQLWESTGDFTKAMESYVKALENEPNNAPALTSIARLHFRQGNHRQAAEFFKKAVTQKPQDAGLHNDLGLTLSKLKQHDAAATSLQRALDLAPGTSRYANNLASVKFESGDVTAAYNVLASNNKPAVAHFNMAYLHFKRNQMNEARGHLSQAMQYEPHASQDSAVKRAVDRSRDMLAQINGSIAPIAQAGPQTSIAGLPKGTIQQTSQAQAPNASPHIAPASSVGPATATISGGTPPWAAAAAQAKPQAAPSTPSAALPGAGVTPGTGAVPSAGVTPSASVTPNATATPSASVTPSATTAPSADTTPNEGAAKPSVPFSLPTGFGMPGQ